MAAGPQRSKAANQQGTKAATAVQRHVAQAVGDTTALQLVAINPQVYTVQQCSEAAQTGWGIECMQTALVGSRCSKVVAHGEKVGPNSKRFGVTMTTLPPLA